MKRHFASSTRSPVSGPISEEDEEGSGEGGGESGCPKQFSNPRPMIIADAAVGSGGACECADGRDGTRPAGPQWGREGLGGEVGRGGAYLDCASCSWRARGCVSW